jgi:hypothetical protein
MNESKIGSQVDERHRSETFNRLVAQIKASGITNNNEISKIIARDYLITIGTFIYINDYLINWDSNLLARERRKREKLECKKRESL